MWNFAVVVEELDVPDHKELTAALFFGLADLAILT